MTLTITKDTVAAVMASIKQLTGNQVLIGIPDSTAGREDGPISNAAIGYIQENGSPAANIPARPFLVPGVNAARDACIAALRTGAKKALDGDKSAGDAALNVAGLKAQSSVRRTLTAGDGFASLAPSTLAARRARGRTGTRPLVDSGQLRNSITYVVRSRGQ